MSVKVLLSKLAENITGTTLALQHSCFISLHKEMCFSIHKNIHKHRRTEGGGLTVTPPLRHIFKDFIKGDYFS